MRTRPLVAIGAMTTTFVLVVGCAATTAGKPIARAGNAQSLPSTIPTASATATATVTVRNTVTVAETQIHISTAALSAQPQSVSPAVLSDAEIRAEVGNAVGVVETYWSELFSTWVDDDGNPVAWWQPKLLNGDGFYDSAAGSVPSCGTDSDTAGNAFFCGNAGTGTGFMAWDMQLFRDYSRLGDAVYYMVVAHETAHAAQVRFVHDGEAPAVLDQRELQADCIGGATLARAEQDGYLQVDDGDLAEMTQVSLALGDFSGGDHGTPEQRDTWFQRGYHGDIESCLGNR